MRDAYRSELTTGRLFLLPLEFLFLLRSPCGFLFLRLFGVLTFAHVAYSYVAYSGIGRGWNFEGLLVYKGRTLVMHKACKEAGKLLAGVSASDINAPEDAAGDFVGPP